MYKTNYRGGLIQETSKYLAGNQLLEGEKHLPQMVDGKLTNSNFIGPGTQIEKRMELGEKWMTPVSKLDSVAKNHDLDYYRAGKKLKKDGNRVEFLKEVKRSDNEFIEKANKQGMSGKLSAGLIGLKSIAETTGILDTKTFSGSGYVKNKKTKKKFPDDKLRKKAKSAKTANQEGGFIPLAVAGASLATGALTALGGNIVNSLYKKFFGKKGGSLKQDGKRLTVKEKREMLKTIPHDQLLQAIEETK